MKIHKIVALSCSPSKGRNSDTMLNSFIEGASSVSGVEIEKIYLNDIYIETFKFENSTGPTENEKEFAELVEKIKNSDALVIATPTYNFSVPAQLKNFIDRMRFFSLDLNEKNFLKQPVGKLCYLKTYFIVSGGTPNWAQKILFFAFPPFWLRGIFLYYNAHVLGALYSGNVRTFENKSILNNAKRKGIKFAQHVRKDKRNRVLERIFFRPPQVD
ncbi:MAG: NAD(P)H-dependent oxidoreductase [Candidatus Paceibacterota bacterium]